MFDHIFDTYIDQSNNHDVDIDEFKNGLRAIRCQLDEEQMNKLFNFLLLNDNSTQYIEQSTFTDFLLRRYGRDFLYSYKN